MNEEMKAVFDRVGIDPDAILADLAASGDLPDVPFEKRVEGTVILFDAVGKAIEELRKGAVALLKADPHKGPLVPEDYDPELLCPTLVGMMVEVFEHAGNEVAEIASGEDWFDK